MYMTNKDIIRILLKYEKDKSKVNENEVFSIIKIMAEKCKFRREFIGYINLHDDMISNAYFFFFHNLKKGNIRVKNVKVGQISTTTKYCEQLPSQEIIVKEKIKDKLYVRKIEKISSPGRKVKKFNYLDEVLYEINYVDVKFNDVFAYITSIINTSFWKVIKLEKMQKRLGQMLFNFEANHNNWFIGNDSIEYDQSSDYEKEKIYEMMQESIEFEKKRVEKIN